MNTLSALKFQSRALLALVVLAFSGSLSAQEVKFYGTGTIPSVFFGMQPRDAAHTPNGILMVGTVASLPAIPSGNIAAKWTPSSGWVPLAAFFPSNTSATNAFARVISEDGTVIGGSTHAAPAGPYRSPALWTNDGTTLQLLGFLPGAPVNSFPNVGVNCLSADGSVAYGFNLGPGGTNAFRYTAASGMKSIGFLHPGDNFNIPGAHAVSADGKVMVGNSSIFPASTLAAYRYTFTGVGPTGGTMTALSALPGGTKTFALIMTPDASTTIGTSNSPDFPGGQLVRWHEGGSMDALGTPSPDDPTFGFGNLGGVTPDGSAIVFYGGGVSSTGSVSYLRNLSGWFDLQTVISDAGVDLTGWSLGTTNFGGVAGMSRDGTLVYGAGTHNGNVECWVADFPDGYLTAYGAPPPTIQSVVASPSSIWPPNNKMVPVTVTAEVVDPLSEVTVKIISVSCNEPADGDWQITGPLSLLLRATRDGSGSGRVYTITIEAVDVTGNSSTSTVTVSVPHDRGRK